MCSLGLPGTSPVAQVSLRLLEILLPHALKGWDYRCSVIDNGEPPCSFVCVLGIELRASLTYTRSAAGLYSRPEADFDTL